MSNVNLGLIESIATSLFNKRIRSVIVPYDVSPKQVTVLYLGLGFLALYFSDVHLPQAIQDQAVLAQVQAVKGGAEIILTAGLIYVLTRRSRRAIYRQNERLDAMIAERSILYRVFRHNLRNDINIVMGMSELIHEHSTDTEITQRANAIYDRGKRISKYQNYTSQIEELLDPSLTFTPIALKEMLTDRPLIQTLRDDNPDVSLSLRIPENMTVIAIPQLPSVIDELVENAITHNDNPEPQVSVTVSRTNGMIDICIADNGSGIPEHEQEPIASMEEQQLTHSSGLGLWQAKLACTISGGDLVFPDQSNGGRVILRLPGLTHRNLWWKTRNLVSKN